MELENIVANTVYIKAREGEAFFEWNVNCNKHCLHPFQSERPSVKTGGCDCRLKTGNCMHLESFESARKTACWSEARKIAGKKPRKTWLQICLVCIFWMSCVCRCRFKSVQWSGSNQSFRHKTSVADPDLCPWTKAGTQSGIGCVVKREHVELACCSDENRDCAIVQVHGAKSPPKIDAIGPNWSPVWKGNIFVVLDIAGLRPHLFCAACQQTPNPRLPLCLPFIFLTSTALRITEPPPPPPCAGPLSILHTLQITVRATRRR